MQKYILSALTYFLLLYKLLPAQTSFSFAAIGDYGYAGSAELAVSNLVKSFNPEFIITLGDNNYDFGEESTIDLNIGQYYSEFIFPYYGIYGSGDTVNRFFPSLGNHDWYTNNAMPYLNYFTLPGNERYYEFVKGNVHFFSVDSDHNEPHGRDSSSVQAYWLKNALYKSASDFKIVYFHHPPYSSSSGHGSDPEMQWPFKKWGASIVLAGHDHNYERIFFDSLTYIVNGLGGRSLYSFNKPVEGSIARYSKDFGAMIFRAYKDSLAGIFYSISDSIIDNFVIQPSKKNLKLRLMIEGMFNPESGIIKEDSINIKLRKAVSPYEEVESSINYSDNEGKLEFILTEIKNATSYYLQVNHRNSIETWSAGNFLFFLDKMDYDFTTDSLKAYGNNLKLKGGKYCIYSGDVNQDGFIDANDNMLIDNLSAQFSLGYLPEDLNGDDFVDASDLLISENNSSNFIHAVIP
ncbi:MAG: hypothetical protein HGGPFJEG_01808 [Ignavibacteria bacterium]|nr:hypothetical protein [Ignavibacteria bacterium]